VELKAKLKWMTRRNFRKDLAAIIARAQRRCCVASSTTSGHHCNAGNEAMMGGSNAGVYAAYS